MEINGFYSYHFPDKSYSLKNVIGVDSLGKKIALSDDKRELSYNGQLFYTERLGLNLELSDSREDMIRTIMDRFQGVIVQCKQRTEEKLKRFIKLLKQKKLYDHYFRLIIEPNPQKKEGANWFPITLPDDDKVIRDYEWPLEAAIARLLSVNPYSKIPYPKLKEIINVFIESRKLRHHFILETTRDYELYYDEKIIFKKVGNKSFIDKKSESVFYMLTQYRLDDLAPWLQISEDIELLLSFIRDREQLLKEREQLLKENEFKPPPIIDEPFINHVIEKRVIPLNLKKRIEKFKGLSIAEALIESNVYGNIKRKIEIERAEINPLDTLEKSLFASIYWMCLGDESCGFRSQEWNKLSLIYKYLEEGKLAFEQKKAPGWLKLKAIHRYLCNEADLSTLNLNPENVESVLRFTKMFDLSISHLHLWRDEKIEFKRGSYELRKHILELLPSLSSIQVFSKTLHPQKLNDPLYVADSKNWVDRRVGLHAKLFANAFILALSLSDRIGTNSLIGVRGNTASGKSKALEIYLGVLNTDPIKKGLKVGSHVKNHQVHFEGAMIFDLCFDEIEKNTRIHYIIDLRLISLEDIQKYLIEPAKKRNCTVHLSDFDVPLVTTLVRVLNRDPEKLDPIPSLQPMVEGFRNIRKSRESVLNVLEQERVVEEYILYFQGKMVGKKENDVMVPVDSKGYEECLRKPTDDEIESCLNCMIDDAFIQGAIIRKDIESNDYTFLEKWKGKTVRESLQIHANS